LLWVVPLTYVTEVSEQRHAVLIKHRSEQSKNLDLFYLILLIIF